MKWLGLAVVVVLTGCFAPRVTMYEQYESEFTLCGNKAARLANYDAEAQKVCSNFTRVGMKKVRTGITDVGFGTWKEVNNTCYLYKCKD
jgi:hypothetical protein